MRAAVEYGANSYSISAREFDSTFARSPPLDISLCELDVGDTSGVLYIYRLQLQDVVQTLYRIIRSLHAKGGEKARRGGMRGPVVG